MSPFDRAHSTLTETASVLCLSRDITSYLSAVSGFYLPHLYLVGVGPSERNPVRTKASFDLMGRMFSFCWAFVPMGFRSSGMALCSVLPTDCNEIY